MSSDHSVAHPAPHPRVTLLKRPGTPRVNSHWPGPRRSRQRSLTVLGRHCQRRASDLARPSACWNSARCGAVLIQDHVSHPFLCIRLNSLTRLGRRAPVRLATSRVSRTHEHHFTFYSSSDRQAEYLDFFYCSSFWKPSRLSVERDRPPPPPRLRSLELITHFQTHENMVSRQEAMK